MSQLAKLNCLLNKYVPYVNILIISCNCTYENFIKMAVKKAISHYHSTQLILNIFNILRTYVRTYKLCTYVHT